MSQNIIFVIYLTSLILYLLTETALVLLNLRSAKTTNPELEKKIIDNKSLISKEKSYDYTKDKSILHLISIYLSSIALLLFIKHGLFGCLDNFITQKIENFYIRGCVYIFSVSAIFSIINLPLQLFSIFVIEQRFGFNKMTFSLWIKDCFKGILLSLILMTPLIYSLLYFINTFPTSWWIYGFSAVLSFQLLIMILYPVLIAPIFNKFEKLKDLELEDKINTLAKQVNFETSGIYQIDGSKRSSHANAYFAGFGKSRRIVLFDTLISKLTHEEVSSVLAHEIGHAKKYHILKSILLSGIILLFSFYLISKLINNSEFFSAFGINNPSSYALFVLISIAFEPITFFISPLFSSFSRKNEFEADKYAVEVVKTATHLENALIKLSIDSLSNLNPHPLYSFFHYSHPTLLERIRAMNKVNTPRDLNFR